MELGLENATNVSDRARAVVEEIKQGKYTLEQSCTTYKAMRDAHDALAAKMKDFKASLDTVKSELLPDMFQSRQVTSITVEGYRFTVSSQTKASIRSGEKDEAFDWLRKNNLGDLIVETVNSQTLSSAAKQLMSEGKELDEDLFNVFLQPTTSVTKVG